MKFTKFWQVLLFSMFKFSIMEGDGGGNLPPDDKDKGDKDKLPDDKVPPSDKTPGVSDNEAKLLKEVMQKKDALKKASDELNDLKAKLSEFDGIDPAAIKTLLAEKKSAEEKQLEAKGEWERLKARMAEEHGKEVTSVKEQLESLRSQLAQKDAVIGNLSVGTQFSQSKFIADELILPPSKARVVYGDYFDVAEDGSVVGYDKPRSAANRTALVNGQGDNLSFDEALRKIVEADPEKDRMLKSKIKPGAGSDTKPGVKPNQKPVEVDSVSKIASGLKLLGGK